MPKPHGITVTLWERTQTGTDDFNAPIYDETAVSVDNVLVAPEDSSESLDSIDLHTKKLRYILGIPKGDGHTWTGTRVSFFGQNFKVITKPEKGIDELVPLQWNAKVTVEKIE